jgi:hypothetical protein
VQVQGTLAGDTNPADWTDTQTVSTTGSETFSRLGGGTSSNSFDGSVGDDTPNSFAIYQAPGAFDWLDAPGWGKYQGSNILAGASLTQTFTSTLRDGAASCSVSWSLTFTFTNGAAKFTFKLN